MAFGHETKGVFRELVVRGPSIIEDVSRCVRGLESMKSLNFEFLRSRWKELALLGGFAEQYVGPDPASAAVKLRSYAEQIVESIWTTVRLPTPPFQANLHEKLAFAPFQTTVPAVVVSKLHALRIHGNKAAHGETVSGQTASWLLREAWELGRWLFIAHGEGTQDQCPTFVEPSANADDSKSRLQREKKAVLEKLAAQEAEMQQLLAELEKARAAAQIAEATVAERQSELTRGQAVADSLSFDEATTRRRLIDEMLRSAGWDVSRDGTNTSTVRQEVEVQHQPTDTGIGYADYVLFGENDKPIAVIEAKKTARDAEQGRTQAKCYADGLDKMTGQRPVIFYTNGYDVWIWNDSEEEPPRRIYGISAKDSLEYMLFRRQYPLVPSSIAPSPTIAGRLYQIEAVKRVVERFASKRRRALIVQATGTGKTRVAVSLCDAMIRAKRAKRILFLCDRRELRKQAFNVFKQFLQGEPRTFVTASTSQDRDKRIYLATYPAMMKCFESFDVGFFDLVIADESHRSIYNRYRDIFEYFDALHVGLTATPVSSANFQNTFRFFLHEDHDPTVHYGLDEAITQGYLVPFRVEEHTTDFLRRGIKYSQFDAEQRQQLDEQEAQPEQIEFEQQQVDKVIFNKDTNRKVIRNLMEHGVRDATATRVGKTIIFARNHNHAVLLQNLFDEMYPQYGGNFCRVIDHYDTRADDLIDDFKGEGTNPDLTIAISVDMLDTGIDVPEIVNLVFAKPVYSYVKFWQMIGRGTRLCENLFGPGRNKTHFLIFDHWGNFDFFEERYKPADTSPPKSLLQRLFECRIKLAEVAIDQHDTAAFDLAIELMRKDIADLPERSVSVREKWKQVKTAQREEILKQFDAVTKGVLFQDVAPLMQWRNIVGHEAAHQFDLRICQAQIAKIEDASRYSDLTDDLRNQIEQLQMNLSQVRAKAAVISEVRSTSFWTSATIADLDRIRVDLRGIMQFRQPSTTSSFVPKVIDITEDDALIERKPHNVKLEGLDLVAYRQRVQQVLNDLFEQNPTLQRIRTGESVSEPELQSLAALVLSQDSALDLNDLLDYYPETAGHLDEAIRAIIGLDGQAVRQRFEQFVHAHPALNATQIRFLDMLQNHIARYGAISVERLYEDPFTTLHNDGLDGVFTEESTVQELLEVLRSFSPNPTQGGTNE